MTGRTLAHYEIVRPVEEADGVHFIAMELVEGRTLAKMLIYTRDKDYGNIYELERQ